MLWEQIEKDIEENGRIAELDQEIEQIHELLDDRRLESEI